MNQYEFAFAAAVAAATIALISNWLASRLNSGNQVKIAREGQIQTRRTQRHEYLIWLMHELVEARIAYEAWLGKVSTLTDSDLFNKQNLHEEHAAIIGRAISVCLASGDNALRDMAENPKIALAPYILDNDPNKPPIYVKNVNRKKLHEALNRLGILIAELTNEPELSTHK